MIQVRQRKTDTVCYYLHEKSKNVKPLKEKKKKGKKVKLCLPEDGSREIRAQTCKKY